MIGWEMAEILHFEILRKHGQTDKHTNKHTDRQGHYNTSPSPYGGRGNNNCSWIIHYEILCMITRFELCMVHTNEKHYKWTADIKMYFHWGILIMSTLSCLSVGSKIFIFYYFVMFINNIWFWTYNRMTNLLIIYFYPLEHNILFL